MSGEGEMDLLCMLLAIRVDVVVELLLHGAAAIVGLRRW